MQKVISTFDFTCANELVGILTSLAYNRTLDLNTAYITGPNGESFNRFKLVETTLTDGSQVTDIELVSVRTSIPLPRNK